MASYAKRVFAVLILTAILPLAVFTQDLSVKDSEILEHWFSTRINDYINGSAFNIQTGYNKKDSTMVDSIRVRPEMKQIELFLDKRFIYSPIRENTIDSILSKLTYPAIPLYPEYSLKIFSDGKKLHEYIPVLYLDRKDADPLRIIKKFKRKAPPITQNISKPALTDYTLYNMNIALWHSHGWYYEPKLHRWEWQRARLFNTVEDLHPMSYTMNFLVPMLENAGSAVFIPRERDWQTNEVIVDNDSSSDKSLFISNAPTTIIDSCFSIGSPPYIDENPFKTGTALKFRPGKNDGILAEWIPDIPVAGYYPVYVSWYSSSENSEEAEYTVFHSGGTTSFRVNQKMGGGTWIYLGKFKFNKGLDEQHSKVTLSCQARKKGRTVTADAVRFGGGMGNISRNGLTSQRPRYQEAARYYLQYAGFPDTLVWKLNKDDDYKDDYQSRGEWVDYLIRGSEFAADPEEKGPAIPLDLSFAFHTDAGITNSDTVIGTLGIYSTKIDSTYFPSGLSKLASRDLTDIIQTQIVEDIRAKYDPAWVRRGLWDRGYSEAYRPNIPSMLLELYSHQNFIDARFGKEPGFQFDVSRSIYKGMVKFLTSLYDLNYIIQPLPISHFQTKIIETGDFLLSWRAQSDPLEPTANPDAFIVFMKKNDEGYDNGTLVYSREYILNNPEPEIIYSFRVSAVNGGGESFPSEELSVCKSNSGKETILIVNAFDRTGGPSWFNDENYAGYIDNIDQGVPYMYDFHTTGEQYDYSKDSPWLDDDSPGFGASSAETEALIIPGNTFNFSLLHGVSIRDAGYSFVSVSDEIFETGSIESGNYAAIDLIAGEEKTTFLPKNDTTEYFRIFTPEMIRELSIYLDSGGNLLLSGAHIATDIRMNGLDSIAAAVMKYKWRTSSASRSGFVTATGEAVLNQEESIQFNTSYHPDIYIVEAADALEPVDSLGTTFLRYTENNMSAGVAYKGKYNLIALGFPFETILNPDKRNQFMQAFLYFLLEDNDTQE